MCAFAHVCARLRTFAHVCARLCASVSYAAPTSPHLTSPHLTSPHRPTPPAPPCRRIGLQPGRQPNRVTSRVHFLDWCHATHAAERWSTRTGGAWRATPAAVGRSLSPPHRCVSLVAHTCAWVCRARPGVRFRGRRLLRPVGPGSTVVSVSTPRLRSFQHTFLIIVAALLYPGGITGHVFQIPNKQH